MMKNNKPNGLIDSEMLTAIENEPQREPRKESLAWYVWALVFVMVFGLLITAYIFWSNTNRNIKEAEPNINVEIDSTLEEANNILLEKSPNALDFSPNAIMPSSEDLKENEKIVLAELNNKESSLKDDIATMLGDDNADLKAENNPIIAPAIDENNKNTLNEAEVKIEDNKNSGQRANIAPIVDENLNVSEENIDKVNNVSPANVSFEGWSDEKKQEYLEALEREEESLKLLKAIMAAESKVKAEDEAKKASLALQQKKQAEELAKKNAELAQAKVIEVADQAKKQEQLAGQVKQEKQKALEADAKAQEAKQASLVAEKEAQKATQKAQEASKIAESASISSFWVINISSTTDEEESKLILNRLQQNNLGATLYSYSATVDKRQYYRIRAGFFETKDDAEKIAKKFTESHKLASAPWVVQPNAGEVASYYKK